ncbi:MAG: efflux RND transporter periplasmic adaptor subunit [Gemmatimonadetes bacterium]|jgi:HlyD family secretion protein|nr:efflux RND transporter periplasmic adaptor subunit [Gemmatimonadota bacterium]MBP7548735.1 efflux RND transporter periplasmic adaptor subunit [Gemmatimonadaceae bacterium]
MSTAHRSLRRAAAALLIPAVAVACGRDDGADAYGNFEAIETVVAAQTSGPIERFLVVEGQQIAAGALAAVLDSTTLSLDQRQMSAQRAAVSARLAELDEQLGVLEVQREIASRAYDRVMRLSAQQAATAQQVDQAEREHRTVLAQLEAARAQRRSITLETAAVEARVAQARDRVSRTTVMNPVAGTVLAVYARVGEVVGPGQPLYKVAALDTLELRAYVSGDQLGGVRLGQVVDVRITQGDGLTTLQGTVSWIASQSEFTPTPVQTRDERSDLVYAIKVRVPNPNGVLKIGMPADLSFTASQVP